MRYSPWGKAALRGSIGRGKRSANIFAENQNMFATSRLINILNSQGRIYGLDPEIAWNYGLSFLQGFNLFNRKADITLDFYRTDFENQIVVDYENPTEVNFYNLNGDSYANSFQAEFNYNPFEQFDVRLAYKFYDVKTQYNSGKLEKPLTPKQRLFANVSYATSKSDKGSQWKFDTTFNWVGEQRFSSTQSSPLEYQLPDYSPTIATLNAQITKVFSNSFEIYFGGENITDVSALGNVHTLNLSNCDNITYVSALGKVHTLNLSNCDNITDVSEAFAELSGYTKNELIGNKHSMLKSSDTPPSLYKKLWGTISDGKKWVGIIKNIAKDGSTYWLRTYITPEIKDNDIVGFTANSQNITDQKNIEEMSIKDELTQAYNRRYFNQMFPKELKRARRNEDIYCIAMLDIDYFKNYNDTYGHLKGDEALQKVVSTVSKKLQSPGDYLFRVGG